MVLGRRRIKNRAALNLTFMNPLTKSADVDRLDNHVVNELNSLKAAQLHRKKQPRRERSKVPSQ